MPPLTRTDTAYGCDLGKWRAIQSVGLRERQGSPTIGAIGKHIYGALAEVAAARALSLPLPTSIGTFHTQPDLPPDLEVRWTIHRTGHLRIDPRDVTDRRFILVTGDPPDLHVVGWILGTDGQRQEWWMDRGHGYSWWVPQQELNDIGDL